MPELFSELGAGPAARAEREAGMVYYPTLLIGLGGSGAQVMLRVKKLLAERGENGKNSLHRFLFLDTDRASFNARSGLPAIEPAERCLIGVEAVEPILRHPDTHAHIWQRFPKHLLQSHYVQNLRQGIGAGQVRSLGALAFAADYLALRQRLETAFNDLIQLSNRQDVRLGRPGAAISSQVAIYLAGSLCGGTGSGCFLDAALLARDVCGARQPKLVGFFLLPCAAFDNAVTGDPLQKDRLRANAYAALKELQYVLDTGAPERQKAILYAYGNQNTLSLEPGDPLFTLVYLAGDTNAGGRLGSLEELFELTARAIFQDVGSPFGTNARSFEANNQVLTGVATCPETNRKRVLGSFATSALVYPAERVSRYCTFRALKEILYDHVLGTAADTSTVEGLVTAFLQQHQLDDRGRSDQILESLLLDKGRNEVLSSASLGLSQSFGRELRPRDFVEQLQQQWRHFEVAELASLRRVVEDNLSDRLGRNQLPPRDPLEEAVRKFLLEVAARHNAATARRAFEELETVVAQMRAELTAELQHWHAKTCKSLEQDFHQRCDELSRLSWLQTLGLRDERLKGLLIRLFNDRVDAMLRAEAKPHALQLLEALSSRIHAARALCESVYTDLLALAREAEAQSQRLETHAVPVQSQFAVEIELTERGYERRYYSKAIRADELFAKIVERHNDRRGLYAWLFSTPPADRTRTVGNSLGEILGALVGEPLKRTHIVDFVSNEENREEISDKLEAKLDLLFELCQPFWDAQPVQTAQVFPEFLGVNVAFLAGPNGTWTPPPLVKDWIAKHGPQGAEGQYQLVPGDVPYEIVLGRRSYGARAYYLRAAKDWRAKYQQAQATAKGNFMLETHVAFADAPDLFPVNTQALELFALGLALGFIVTRGDWYYFGLERRGDAIHVLYTSQAQVAHSLTAGQTCGRVVFALANPNNLPAKSLLAQGRQAAAAALREHPGYMELIAEACDEYHKAVGNDTFRGQLEAYVSTALESHLATRPELEGEKNAILRRIDQIGR